MRIRPSLVTATASLVAMAAIATVVLSTTPSEAGVGLIRLLWIAVFLAAWSMVATLMLWIRQSMAVAVWVGLWWACAGGGLLVAQQRGTLPQQLLVGIILATLVVSVFTWWRLRRVRAHD